MRIGLLMVALAGLLGSCSVYPPAELIDVGRGVTWCERLCYQANLWAEGCAMPQRKALDPEACRARLEDSQWPVDQSVCEFNAWCYAAYRSEGFCEPLGRTNVESGYWQPTVTLPELGCVDEWPEEWLPQEDGR